MRASSHLAIGDLEGDGIPEIVGYGPDTKAPKVIAFTNTGKVKWVSSETVPNSSYNYGGISIADLDGDGKAEILARSNVYNSDGSLRWSTGYYTWDITTSIAADLDNDGLQEVIIGHDAYRHDGTPYWPVTRAGGFTAIGNFDDDEFPEVVFRNFPSVQLIDQDGSIIWSVNHPTGYRGGAPIVADFDGDGAPEIGVPGGSSYVMFDGDGSILWEYRGTSDGSAAGAAAFDFNGDGRMEVVYGDHSYLRVFDGLTGKVIFRIPNSSPTASEMPTVADIDADGHAEILVQSSRGLHAIEDRNDTWLATRKLWNQYQYHIDNINDDLSIPAHPKPSWLTHNTFRLNTFPDRNPLDRADLSVALLRLVDNGIGQPQSLTARIGNGGLLSITQPIQVAFYQGNSVANGVLLGIIELDSLAHGTYIDIRLDGISLNSEEPLYAIVDPDDQYLECNETNNSMSIPFSAPLSGTIVVSTDASSYGAQNPITLQTTVTNNGSFTSDYRVILAIVDSSGILVTQFDAQSATALNSGASLDLSQLWNTGTYAAGVYTLIGTLLDEQGQVLDIASTLFTITPGSVAHAPKAALTVNTDQAQYLTDDRVLISNLLRNLTTNALLDDVRVELQVYNPASKLVFSYTHTVGQLSASALRTLEAPQILKNAAVGMYTVKATLIGSGEGLKNAVLGQGRLKAYGVDITLATATTRYTVVSRNGTAQDPQPGLQRIPTLGTTMLMLMSALLTLITACMRRRSTTQATRPHHIQATGEGR